jgi:hypothetical protein
MVEEKLHHGHKWMPAVYVTYYGMLKDIAMEHGYALAIHGSITRDFDLIAVPWVEHPKKEEELVKAIYDIIGINDKHFYTSKEIKPHGRTAYTISSGAGGYFDISIIKTIPNSKDCEHYYAEALGEEICIYCKNSRTENDTNN